MPPILINSVEVDFPFEPYDCQIDYMKQVISSLQNKTNAILESPTGTGKTLCILCSVLAWRQTCSAQHQLQGFARGADVFGINDAVGEGAATEAGTGVPKIIYASRTHSQISQVIKELKNTVYKPKMAVIGSRDQLCLHPKVMNITNQMAKIHTCRAKVKQRSCVHYTNVEQKITDKVFNEIMDIEELVEVTKTKTMCPYYTSRELFKSADIIFMPYNYLIDQKIRKSQNIVLKNAIVIFDEAHNIEKVCEEAFSFELTSTDIANCIGNCDLVIDSLADDSASENDLSKEDVVIMKSIFLSLEREFQNIKINGKGSIIDKETFKSLLTKTKITSENQNLISEVLQKMESVLSINFNNKILGSSLAVLGNFSEMVNLTLGHDEDTGKQYICYGSKEFRPRSQSTSWAWKTKENTLDKPDIIKLSYWCFSPGVAMKDFIRQDIYSIILTSGTLSPLSSFSAELKIPFPITLQNPHVIKNDQLNVQVICHGPDGVELTSSYNNRSNFTYLRSLGSTIINFLRIIPKGVLVFFPSYMVANTCISFWKEKNIFEKMEKIKTCFIEPKSKNECKEVLDQFDKCIREPSDVKTGAVLFAVCRGKVSEGIDFSDVHGRAVIITGLPFPPRQDPKVAAKISFLDAEKRKGGSGLGGNEWYIQQCTRAVNQAVGRVIRHRNDYGVVLFMDKRFSYPSNKEQLPKWVQGSVKVHDRFGASMKEVSGFFKKHNIASTKLSALDPGPSFTKPPSMKYYLFEMNRVDRKGPSTSVMEENVEVTPPPKRICRPEKRESLVTSLRNCDAGDFEMPASLTASQGTSNETDYKTPDRSLRIPKKRICIVREKKADSGLEQLKNTETGAVSKLYPSDKVEKTKAYLAKLKKVGEVEFKNFTNVLKEYRSTNDIEELVKGMLKLFADRRDLVEGLRVFLKPGDIEHYDRYLSERE